MQRSILVPCPTGGPVACPVRCTLRCFGFAPHGRGQGLFREQHRYVVDFLHEYTSIVPSTARLAEQPPNLGLLAPAHGCPPARHAPPLLLGATHTGALSSWLGDRGASTCFFFGGGGLLREWRAAFQRSSFLRRFLIFPLPPPPCCMEVHSVAAIELLLDWYEGLS